MYYEDVEKMTSEKVIKLFRQQQKEPNFVRWFNSLKRKPKKEENSESE